MPEALIGGSQSLWGGGEASGLKCWVLAECFKARVTLKQITVL